MEEVKVCARMYGEVLIRKSEVVDLGEGCGDF